MLLFEPPIMEAAHTNINHNGISDVELLEFLVGYNSNSSNNNTTCQQHQEQLHQPWRSYHHHQTYQSPINIQIPMPEPTPPSPTKRKISEGMVERWEPGEVKSDVVVGDELKAGSPALSTSSSSSASEASSHAKSTPPSDVYVVPSPTPTPKKRGPRPKILTKQEKRQKRLDANDRERDRMGRLNSAFDSLRHLLPRHGNDRELSKFETIQIAKNYIRALNDMLVEADSYFGQQQQEQQSNDNYYFASN